MEKEVFYKYGHFYDPETKKRIELIDDITLSLIISENYIAATEIVGKYELTAKERKEKGREKEKIEKGLKNIKEFNLELAVVGNVLYQRIRKKGEHLYFLIKRSKDKNIHTHEFRVELLEDLYFYYGSKTDANANKKGRIYDCQCIVRENTSGTIDFFEEIHGKSPNEAYKNTFVHYFGNFGSPAANAVDRFYKEKGKDESKIDTERIEPSRLENIRELIRRMK